LLVVVSLLALFATVGLAFVLYAETEAASSRAFREAEYSDRPDIEPELLLSFFTAQLIYDAPCHSGDWSGHGSALRGHSLARLMFGLDESSDDKRQQQVRLYNGTGRLHRQDPNLNDDEYNLINYTYYQQDGFVRDPERDAGRANPWDRITSRYIGGFNVPYTYPDLNNMFLAAVRAQDGRVLIPSYHRPWTGFGGLEPTNPNWFSPDRAMKYKVLRPRPIDQLLPGETWPPNRPYFPPPEDAGGDVKNLPWAQGYNGGINDSIWLDLGFPVHVLPDGRKFKPLFAPLIIDLDGRININACGNIVNGEHRSNQGWGRWEVNVGKVLSANPSEWLRLFQNNGPHADLARYGSNSVPHDGNQSASLDAGRYYALVDYNMDGLPDAPQGAPPGGAAPPHPNHPSIYSFFSPSGGDLTFDRYSDLEALLRYGDTGSPALTSRLFWRLPRNLQDFRIRNRITTQSFDFDVPGMTAAVPQSDPSYRLVEDPNNRYVYPKATQKMQFPNLPLPQDSLEFRANGQANVWRTSPLGLWRLDLGIRLFGSPSEWQVVGHYNHGRALFAQDLYIRLKTVTGAPPADPNSPPDDPAKQTLRWLAQLAANLVDYIDEDSCNTMFFVEELADQRGRGDPTAWVFGVEMPRVVLYQAVAQAEMQDPQNQNAPTKVKVWAKLYDPFDAPDGPTRLAGKRHPQQGPMDDIDGAYRIVMCKPNTKQHIEKRENTRGTYGKLGMMDPDPDLVYERKEPDPNNMNQQRTVRAYSKDFDPANIQPQSFYLTGPENQCPIMDMEQCHKNGGMRYDVPPGMQPEKLTLLLQRLACPDAPHEKDPNSPNYNPYITIDYLTDITVYQAGERLDASSWAKNVRSFYGGPEPRKGPVRHDLINHLDRQPVSAMEIVHVSTVKPTDYIRKNPAQDGNHGACWFDQNARLYRVFELLGTHDRSWGSMFNSSASGIRPQNPDPSGYASRFNIPGGRFNHSQGSRPWNIEAGTRVLIGSDYRAVTGGGGIWFSVDRPANGSTLHVLTMGDRVPGRVNINTVWDAEVIEAVCDHPNGAAIAQQVLTRRTPGGAPGPNDVPFRGMAVADTDGGPNSPYNGPMGIKDTFLRSGPNGLLFQLPGQTSAEKYSLMAKVFDRFTCRSHVFAVFITVGFFEVIDDTSLPPKLGAEIGRAENRHVRHRMFAIIDRSELYLQTSGSNELTVEMADPVRAGEQTARISSEGDIHNLYKGQGVTVEEFVPANPPRWEYDELVTITDVDYDAKTVTAVYRNVHPNKGVKWRLKFGGRYTFSERYAPAPRETYNAAADMGPVKFFSVID
jgi:hypothetical protein